MEFISTAFQSHQTAYSLENFEERGKSFEEVFYACLRRPGFFAHNLITLAAAHRLIAQGRVSDPEILLGKVLQMTKFDCTPMRTDNVLIERREYPVTDSTFHSQLHEYLLHGPRDPHVITSAHSFYYLWNCSELPRHRSMLALNLEFLKV